LALWLTHDVKYVFDLGMDGSWVNLGLILLCVAWVFGCQENGSEHKSVCMLCLVYKKVKENNRKGVSAFQLVFCGGKW
jgi:hypothetical protein